MQLLLQDVTEAVVREVFEETGVRANFDCVLLMRQAHGFAFGKSDMFILCALKPEPGQSEVSAQAKSVLGQGSCLMLKPEPGQSEVSALESEIEAVQWMPLEEFQNQGFFSGVPLYEKLQGRCVSYADGVYKGLAANKLHASLPTSMRKRDDLLIFGE
eukprot:gene4892-34658_t